jgi:hypothetical protein
MASNAKCIKPIVTVCQWLVFCKNVTPMIDHRKGGNPGFMVIAVTLLRGNLRLSRNPGT